MGLFGFKSSKEVEEEKRKAAEQAAKQVVANQQKNLSNLGKGSQIPTTRVPFFDVFDPRLPEEGVPCVVEWSMTYAVEDIDLYNSLNKSQSVDDEVFKKKVKDTATKFIKGCVINVPDDCQIPVVQMERKIIEISDYVGARVGKQIYQTMGITVRSFEITAIEFDKQSRGWRELRTYTSDMQKEKMMAQHSMSLSDMKLQHDTNQSNFKLQNTLNQSNIALQNSLNQDQLKMQSSLNLDAMKRQQEMTLGGQEEMQKMQLEMQRLQSIEMQKMQMENMREDMRIKREEAQRYSKLQTEQTFLGAHQANLKSDTMNNALDNGFNVFKQQQPQTSGSMFGGGVGQMQNMPQMPGFGQMGAQKAIPQVQYMLAVNGQAAGPFDWNQLKQLVQSGQLTQQTLVFTNGMQDWAMAGQVQELQPLFAGQAPAMGGMPGIPKM